MERWMLSAVTISFKWRATMFRPGDAKMSPIKRRFVKEMVMNWSAPPGRPSHRHLTPNLRGEPSERLQASPWRLAPPELAHQRLNRDRFHDIEHWINL